MTSREETGACLRALRALRGWSQRQAAAAARLPPTRLSDYESGKTSPTLDRLEALVTALGFPMLTFEITRQLLRTVHPAAPPHRQLPSRRGPARVLELHGRAEELPGARLAVGLFVVPRTDAAGRAEVTEHAPCDVRQAAPAGLSSHSGGHARSRTACSDRPGRRGNA